MRTDTPEQAVVTNDEGGHTSTCLAEHYISHFLIAGREVVYEF